MLSQIKNLHFLCKLRTVLEFHLGFSSVVTGLREKLHVYVSVCQGVKIIAQLNYN